MTNDHAVSNVLDLPQQHDDRDLEMGALLPLGKHHVYVRDVTRQSGDTSPYLSVKFEVIGGPAAGSIGEEKFFLTDKAAKRLAILGRRLGLLGNDAFGKRAPFNAFGLIGRDLVVEVVHEQYETREGEKRTVSKWGFGSFWPSDDPKVADVPKGVPPPRQATAKPPQAQPQAATPRQTTF